MNQPQESAVLTSALRILAHADNTIAMIKKKLAAKGFSKEAIEQTVDLLVAKGYLNDEKYAEQYIYRCLRNTKKGPKLIFNELHKKGIPGDVCNRLIKEFYTPEQEKTVMNRLIAVMKNKEKKHYIFITLMRRGFRTSTIKELINQL